MVRSFFGVRLLWSCGFWGCLGWLAVALLAAGLVVVRTGDAGDTEARAQATEPPAGAGRVALKPVGGPGILRVGYHEEPPYSWTTRSGDARGFAIDVLSALTAQSGHEVRFVPTHSAEAMVRGLEEGVIDAASLLAITPAREARIAFTAPIDIASALRVGKTGFGTFADPSGKRAGLLSEPPEPIAGGVEAVDITSHDGAESMTMASPDGKVDGVIWPFPAVQEQAMRLGSSEPVKTSGAVPGEVRLAIGLARDRPALHADLDGALAALRVSGRLDEIAAEYFTLPSTMWRDPRLGWALAAIGWLVGLAAALSTLAALLRAERRAKTHIARVTRARDRLAAAHAKLGRTNARLEAANAQLERFANVAAHDLRAPLRALMTLPGWVREELAENGVEPPGEVSSLLDDIFDQAACMDQMLKDLMDYARLGSGLADRTLFQPADRIRDVARMAGMPDEFTLDIAPDMPELELNTVEFDTVMRNLLSNAVKHHDRPNGRISVRCWRERAAVTLEVEDDGPGIAPEHRDRVFEIFATLGKSENASGGGMGLAFVRRIVESWGGLIQVRKPPGGRGVAFRMMIPVSAMAAAA